MAVCHLGMLLLVVLVGGGWEALAARTVEHQIREDADLSQFYQLLELSQIANSSLMLKQVTVFAPTNQAFQKYTGKNEDLVLYHMSNLAQTTSQFGQSLLSELTANPPLWVTRKKTGLSFEDIYINNAKIIKERSNYESSIRTPGSMATKKQVLHIISEVLEPVISNSETAPIYNPNAFEFLNQSDSLKMGDHRLRLFRGRVVYKSKQDIFKVEGGYTFFIPVEEGFKPAPRPELIDEKVIDGHVVPNHVLFTAPTPENRQYNTLAFSDNLKVTVSFFKEQKGTRTYVKSTTLGGDSAHPAGVVLAEIVKANIPVRNGVIHLIQRPLMVVDTTVKQFLEEKDDGPVYKFYQVIRDLGDDFMNTLTNLRGITLFAPNNAAWEDPSLNTLFQNKKRMREILDLHYVREKLTLEDIVKNNKNKVPTAAIRKSLYFNVHYSHLGKPILTVEGGGVNATVTTSNIAATNGIIHIIDRVLGIPYTTVLKKLKTDPMMNATYLLGQRAEFNYQLNDTSKRFTYFVPSDTAWKGASIVYPSAFNKIFMKQYSYHAKQILERHLIVSDQTYTMAKLKALKSVNINDLVGLPTVRDNLKLNFKESGENYFVEWQGVWIRVVRPDVECTNGIIHVIDSVFLKDSDVHVTGGASITIFAPHVFTILIAKWVL